MPQVLLPLFPAESTPINDLLSFEKRDGTVWYFHGCLPLFAHEEDDQASFRMFTSHLVVAGQCKQMDIVRAFGVSAISVKRQVKKFREGGARAFFQRPVTRKPRVWTPEVIQQAQGLLNEGKSRRQVAETLDLKPDTLYRAIRSGRLVEPEQKGVTQSDRSVADGQASMGMGCTRVVERVLASMGKLPEAPSRFQPEVDVGHGGVLWALPALLSNGLLRHTRTHFQLPKGFYGVVHVFMLLAFMALLRIKANEQLRYEAPGEWGRLLGLDRIPEVRTLRDKIKHLSETGQVEEWACTLSTEWMEAEPTAAGTLYVDGHVRVYHGTQTKLPPRYVARQRLCLRGMSDYWVNDQQGRPFFVVPTPFTSGLLDMLKSNVVPQLLRDVPHQPTDEELAADPYRARFTLVFDREGYSPAFFQHMWTQHRIACMTYHKYPKDPWPESEFREHTVTLTHGESVTLRIAERCSWIGDRSNGLWVREVRKLCASGHQTSIIGTEFQAEIGDFAVRMMARWSQENFFQYMMQHYNIDALAEYKVEPADETKRVVNPAYRALDSQVRRQAGKLGRQVAAFGELSLQPTPSDQELEEYERQKGELIEEIEHLKADLQQLKAKRKETPKHLELAQLPEADQFAQLAGTRKHLVDTIKMIAYRAETAMASLVRPHLAHRDEARALVREICRTPADIVPDEQAQTLTIRLHHLTNPLSNRAAQALADQLNATETLYPGTHLRLRYELVSS